MLRNARWGFLSRILQLPPVKKWPCGEVKIQESCRHISIKDAPPHNTPFAMDQAMYKAGVPRTVKNFERVTNMTLMPLERSLWRVVLGH